MSQQHKKIKRRIARTGLERNRGPGRRVPEVRKIAEEGEMTAAQFEFITAVDIYRRANKRPFPSLTELLEITGQLGYRRVLRREITLSAPEPALFTGRSAKLRQVG